jgi:hypothetical protein
VPDRRARARLLPIGRNKGVWQKGSSPLPLLSLCLPTIKLNGCTIFWIWCEKSSLQGQDQNRRERLKPKIRSRIRPARLLEL